MYCVYTDRALAENAHSANVSLCACMARAYVSPYNTPCLLKTPALLPQPFQFTVNG